MPLPCGLPSLELPPLTGVPEGLLTSSAQMPPPGSPINLLKLLWNSVPYWSAGIPLMHPTLQVSRLGEWEQVLSQEGRRCDSGKCPDQTERTPRSPASRFWEH